MLRLSQLKHVLNWFHFHLEDSLLCSLSISNTSLQETMAFMLKSMASHPLDNRHSLHMISLTNNNQTQTAFGECSSLLKKVSSQSLDSETKNSLDNLQSTSCQSQLSAVQSQQTSSVHYPMINYSSVLQPPSNTNRSPNKILRSISYVNNQS